ncbi:hypothetical protein K3M67_20320 (plasmid) [Sphingobium sp. V4]|uniref:hypothetical protein n=1 Tax=Sphingobium sp. V4 TaxID=3038927 RepID=UPI002557F709|nr:hypothetical protein [Sphingobium sp. V4]WIW90377.1 hypothetical protein K3M67_20320 [Sphingobium sp. V4]
MQGSDVNAHDDDRRHATRIFEAATWGYAVKVTCRCRRTCTFEAHGLWWRFKRKGWSDDFRDAVRCLYCRSCTERTGRKVRPTLMETTNEPPHIRLPLPDEREWKRAVSRNRG